MLTQSRLTGRKCGDRSGMGQEGPGKPGVLICPAPGRQACDSALGQGRNVTPWLPARSPHAPGINTTKSLKQLAQEGLGRDNDRPPGEEAVGRLKRQVHDNLECASRLGLRLEVCECR